MINWIPIQDISQVEEIKAYSGQVPCLIFKHSTRCSISTVARYRLEGDWDVPEEVTRVYFLDLIAYRDVSNYIAETFEVYHESPQVLLIRGGECVFDASHLDITVPELREMIGVSV
jgi:bacillithiol system protein YtxJ